MEKRPKIVLWDLEATNLNANFGYMLCFGYKYLDEKKTHVVSIRDFPRHKKDPVDDRMVVQEAKRVLEDADMWVTWYGRRFDVPYVNTRLMHHKLEPLGPVAHVDGWEIARKHLKFHSNRLAAVAEFLGVGQKTPLSGPIWVKAGAGDTCSIKYIEKHCRQDVVVLEEVYERIKVVWPHHPNLSLVYEEQRCPICGVKGRLQRRGSRITKMRKHQRYQCQKCGGWSHGKSAAVKGVVVR